MTPACSARPRGTRRLLWRAWGGVAVAPYKVAFRAKGMKGEEKLAYQVQAVRDIAEVQHPKVVDMLVKLTNNKNPDIAAAALLGLGDQRRIPGYAGQAVVKVMTIKSKPRNRMTKR